jgi:hypothetical protein
MMLFPHVMIRPLLRGNVATTGAIINLSEVKRKARLGEIREKRWNFDRVADLRELPLHLLHPCDRPAGLRPGDAAESRSALIPA